jgi:hypothetical protein
MLWRAALVGTDVSEERIASIFRVKRIGENIPEGGIFHSPGSENLESHLT